MMSVDGWRPAGGVQQRNAAGGIPAGRSSHQMKWEMRRRRGWTGGQTETSIESHPTWGQEG